MNSNEVFIHIHQGCFAGTGTIVRLPQCQWSKPDGYGKISQCITTTKHSKAKTVCIFLGIYCSVLSMKHTNVTVVLSFLVIILPIIVDSWYIYSFPSKLFHGHYNFVLWTMVTWERGSCRIQSNTEWFSQIPRKLRSHFSIGTSVIHFNSISYANNSYKTPLNCLVSLSTRLINCILD